MADKIPLYYFRANNLVNLGDELSEYLVAKLSAKEVERVNCNHQSALFSIGSILGSISSPDQIVWGSGFISAKTELKKVPKIYALRGPLSLKKVTDLAKIPLGDPALLLPMVYHPRSFKKKYKLGIIPHYIDHIIFTNKFKADCDLTYLILNIATQEIEDFVDQILQCEVVLSSTLHGLIIAQSYGVPAIWVEFSDQVIGNGFKFLDYFLSVSITPYKPIRLVQNELLLSNLYNIVKSFNDARDILNFDREPLLEAFHVMLLENFNNNKQDL